jgi:thiamine biosynthesis lipoprotein
MAASGLEHLDVEPVADGCAVTRRTDIRIDAGAFGKGEGLDRVIRRPPPNPPPNPWMIDLGGQIAVGGGPAWTVALSHPRRRDVEVARVEVESGSLATSGGAEHDVAVEGRTLGHIVDPRTGSTVVSDVSVVVWHHEALVADLLSTALYVMGLRDGFEWAESHGIAAAFMTPEEENGGVEIRATASFRHEFPGVGAK